MPPGSFVRSRTAIERTVVGSARHEGRDRERPVQAHLQEADLLAGGHERVDRFVRGFRARAHHHDHAVGLRVPHVFEEAIRASDARGKGVHRLLDDLGAGGIEAVARLAGLEERIRVLRRAANDGMIGRERAPAVRRNQLVRQHRPQVVVRQFLDLGDLMRRAEAVEEVDERHPGAKRRRLGDEREVVRLLHRSGAEQRGPRLTAGHHVGVIAEDRERVRRERARRHVHRIGGQLARNLVEIGDHQEQTLTGCEGRRQGAGLQGAVDRTGRTSLRLHLDDLGDDAPDVLATLG